jgi:hypothetical protein
MMVKKLPKKEKSYQQDSRFKVFYAFNQNDTVPSWYIIQILNTLGTTLEPYFGESLYKGFNLEIWNELRPDAPFEPVTFNKRTGKIILTTRIIKEVDKDAGWANAISLAVGYWIAYKTGFTRQKGKVYKEWKRIRDTYNPEDPVFTFADDFRYFFGYQLGNRPRTANGVEPTRIQGLKKLMLLGGVFRKKLIKWYDILLWERYLYDKIKGHDYCGLIYCTWNPFRKETIHLLKADHQGHWVFNPYEDKWLLLVDFHS